MSADKRDDRLKSLETDQQPDAGELAEAPTLDKWEVLDRATAVAVKGVVTGSKKFRDGHTIVTSVLKAVDRDRRWIRTQNSVYWLSSPAEATDDTYASWPLILRMAMAPSWHAAYSLAAFVTDDCFIDAKARLALSAASSRFGRSNWTLRREGCRRIARTIDESNQRPGLDECWTLLAVDPDSPADVVESYHDLLAALYASQLGDAPGVDALRRRLYGWYAMHSHTTGAGEVEDPFILAARIDAISGGGGDPGVLAEVLVDPRAEPPHYQDTGIIDLTAPRADEPPGAVVLASVGGLNVSHGRDARKAFEPIVGKKLPFAASVDVPKAHRVLVGEFPHLADAIRVLMGDLQAISAGLRIRPTLLTGPAGAGKSRLVRRLGEVCGLRINRYDAAAASDSSFGGTARRWSSGEPCFALNAILANKTPNGIILVDELDKCGRGGNNGEFTHTLLPMLERETACRYPDPYTQSECDLSFLSFIATVNDDRALPGPLRDRFRLLRIPAPTLDHLPTIARGIVADLARELGGDPRFVADLDDGELAIAESLWKDRSVRRLRAIIERLLAHRESHPRH